MSLCSRWNRALIYCNKSSLYLVRITSIWNILQLLKKFLNMAWNRKQTSKQINKIFSEPFHFREQFCVETPPVELTEWGYPVVSMERADFQRWLWYFDPSVLLDGVAAAAWVDALVCLDQRMKPRWLIPGGRTDLYCNVKCHEQASWLHFPPVVSQMSPTRLLLLITLPLGRWGSY